MRTITIQIEEAGTETRITVDRGEEVGTDLERDAVNRIVMGLRLMAPALALGELVGYAHGETLEEAIQAANTQHDIKRDIMKAGEEEAE